MLVYGVTCPQCLTGRLRFTEDGGTTSDGETFHYRTYSCLNPECLAEWDEDELDRIFKEQ